MSIPQSGGGPIERFEQLADYMAQGSKPAADWRIGTEHEKFGYLTDTLAPLPYEGTRSVRAVLEGIESRFGWTRVEEQGHIIGLTKDGANVSLEPGGQLELSGAAVETLHQTNAELLSHLAEVKAVADPLGVRFMGIGAAPIWRHEDMDRMPKGRYRLMTDYMGRVGTHGTQMMYRTCTVQVNLDFASESDMVKKLRVAIALQPVATALFSSSPFFEGKPNGHKSWRSRIWRGLDNARTGMLPFVFQEGFGFEAYVNYVLDVPMYFVYRDGKYIDALGQSFRDFLKGKLPALPGEVPTLSDWADHMTTVFPEARVKKYIEMRGADAGSAAMLTALPAFWIGLMYDQSSLDAAWDIAKGWDADTREALRVAASVDGLAAQVGGIRMQDLARQVLDLSQAGLAARDRLDGGKNETVFLDPLVEIIGSGKTAADRLLDHYHGDRHGDLTRIYPVTSY
ncbi:MAG: glutamate--cysteine ligase [Gemmobacter sp.]|nr:glutamate--cysteine ligase [Gemmobacter sp.]